MGPSLGLYNEGTGVLSNSEALPDRSTLAYTLLELAHEKNSKALFALRGNRRCVKTVNKSVCGPSSGLSNEGFHNRRMSSVTARRFQIDPSDPTLLELVHGKNQEHCSRLGATENV